jgi:putative endonuclease
MGGYVYILASGPYGRLYVGVNAWLVARVYDHKIDPERGSAFCKKYGVDRLVYYEEFESISEAIHREKRLKKRPRRWKIALIEKANPHWRDLYDALDDAMPLGSPGSASPTVG